MPADKRTISFDKKRQEMLRYKPRIIRETRAEILRLLKLAELDIINTLQAAPSEWQAFHLPQLQQAIIRAMNEFATTASTETTRQASVAHQAGINLVDEPMASGGIQIKAVLPEVDTKQLNAMRLFMTDRIKDIGLTTANKINSQLGLVIIGAQSPGDAIAATKEALKVSRSRAITIVRTEIGRVFSDATQKRQEQAAEVVPGLKKQWRRSGKVHSRFHHDAADGQIVDVDKPFRLQPLKGPAVYLMHPRDPNAPAAETINCGCDSIPYMENWDVANKKKKPFTQDELARSRNKRELENSRKSASI